MEKLEKVIVIIKEPGEPFVIKSILPSMSDFIALVGDTSVNRYQNGLTIVYNAKVQASDSKCNCIVGDVKYAGTIVFTALKDAKFQDVSLNEFLALTKLPDSK